MDNENNTKSNKKSFILYYDNQHFFEMLENSQAGQLIKDIYNYEINNIIPNYEDDKLLQMAFMSIQLCLDRDKEKYNNKCEKNRENIQKRWKSNTENTNSNSSKPGIQEDNETDNDNLDNYYNNTTNNEILSFTSHSGKTFQYKDIARLKLKCDCISSETNTKCDKNAICEVDNKKYCFNHQQSELYEQ